jgi:SEC-C motif
MSETGRNAPCPCGSGKKYKLCCLSKDDPSFQLDSVKRQLVASFSSKSRPYPPPRRRRRRTSSAFRRGALLFRGGMNAGDSMNIAPAR